MALPLLPGNTFNPNIGRRTFNKSQRFGFQNRVRIETDEDSKPRKPYSFATALVGKELDKPSWVAFDKYVLCFQAYFREQIYTSPIEDYRYRKCKIIYFLEDDTMQIIEPSQRNSGISQGTLISRHRFQKPKLNFMQGGDYYTIEDLNVGVTLEIYGQPYTIINCDKFTRDFLTEIGIDVKPTEPDPLDPYTQNRKEMDDNVAPRKPFEKLDKLGQFLRFHPKVLRFYCIWDDRKNMFGDIRKFDLHYYLDNDTIEVIERRPPNSGRDDTNVLLRRLPLPKNVEQMPKPGEIAERTVLNLTGLRNNEKDYTYDNNPIQERIITHYRDYDLGLGKTVCVLNRNFFLYDCDAFTKEFYRIKYGIDLLTVPLPEDTTPPIPRIIAPHNIFGSPEDTIGNCFYIIPRRAKKDLIKFYQKDRIGYDGFQLRFAATLVTDHPINRTRIFLITYFLADDTIQVNEPHQSNSGIMDGKHMMRLRVTKPESPGLGEGGQPIYYNPQDMYIGNVLYMRGNAYLMFDADEYTLDYMEKKAEEFPKANINFLMAKFKDWLGHKSGTMQAKFEARDPSKTGIITFDEFRIIILEEIPEKITEHEMMTVGRYYAEVDDTDLKLDDMISIMQTQLRKRNFSDFERLHLTFQHYDIEKSGHVTPQQLYSIVHAYPVPVSTDVLKGFIYKLPVTESGTLKYSEVMDIIDWQKNPAPFHAPLPSAFDLNWKGEEVRKNLHRISYVPFLEDIVCGLRSEKNKC